MIPINHIGIVYHFNRGSNWVQDDELLNEFCPSLLTLLFEEAARMFEEYPPIPTPSFTVFLTLVGIVILAIALTLRRRKVKTVA
ncbi:MAG: hypothetical protein ACFFC7_12065 [Candidatus Hermodarchaeota archaeon]